MTIAQSHRRSAALASIQILFCVSLLSPVTILAQPDPAAEEQKPETPQSDAAQLDLLRQQLDSPDPNQRAQGIQHAAQLDKKKAPLALPGLIKLLADPSQATLAGTTQPIRDHAIQALGRMGPCVSDQVIEALDDKNPLVRMGAADVVVQLRDPRAVKPLVKLLHDPNRELASRAIVPLGSIGEPSIEPLLAALIDDDTLVRTWAVSALGLIRDRRVVPQIARLLDDPEQPVRDNAGNALRTLATPAPADPNVAGMTAGKDPTKRARQENDALLRKLVLGELNLALRSASARARMAAVQSIRPLAASIRSLGTIDALASCLTDADPALRAQAAQILSQINHPGVYKPLAAALRDADSNLRLSAVQGLAYRLSNDRYRSNIREFDDGFLVAPLIENLSCADLRVSQSAATALVQVRSASKLAAVPDLIELLHSENPDVVAVALRTLSDIHPKQAADPISALLDNPTLRSQAAVALSRFGDPQAVEPLRALANDKDVSAVSALGELKDRQSMPRLIELLHDEKNNVRQTAAAALGNIGDPRAAVPLILLLRSDAELTGVVAESLTKLKDPRAIEPMIATIDREQQRISQNQMEFGWRHARIIVTTENNPLVWPLQRMGFVAIEPLTKALANNSQNVREVAACVLYHLAGPGGEGIDRDDLQPAIEPLVAALADPSAIVRRDAALALGELGDWRAVPELIEAVKSLDEQAYLFSTTNASSYLSSINDPASVQPLIALLSSPKPPIRVAAASTLGYMHEERAIQPLLALLHDPVSAVRGAAATALGNLKAALALDPLLSLLDDDDPEVQLAAVESLGRLGDKHAIDPLATLLAATTAPPQPMGEESPPGLAPDFRLRAAIAIALMRLDDPRGVTAIAACLKDPLDNNREHAATEVALSRVKGDSLTALMIAALGDPCIRVRIYTAVALGHIATPAAVDALLANTDDRENLSDNLSALAETKDDRAVDALARFLDDSDPMIRRTAAASIATLGDPAGTEPLIAHLSDQSTEVRAALIDALLKLKAKSALPALRSLADNDDPNVRARAERAIKRLDR